MRRALVLLGLSAALLFAWERNLSRRAALERLERSRVGQLVSPEERASLSLSALRIEERGQPTRTYGRVRGRWRCIEHFLAPADVGALESLVQSLLDAQGFVVTDRIDDASAYGVTGTSALRVSLCGPKVLEDPGGDVQLAFDLGSSVPRDGGSFLRRRGEPEVWAVDADPRAFLQHEPATPPLLEPYVVPRDWPGWRAGLTRLRIERAQGSRFVLERRRFELPPEELRAGRVPWRWILQPGSSERDAARLQSHALSLFVQRIPFEEVLDPRLREQAFGAATTDRLVLEAEGVDALELWFAPLPATRGDDDADHVAWNPETGTLFRVSGAVVDLALPSVELFLADSDANPWHPYLER